MVRTSSEAEQQSRGTTVSGGMGSNTALGGNALRGSPRLSVCYGPPSHLVSLRSSAPKQEKRNGEWMDGKRIRCGGGGGARVWRFAFIAGPSARPGGLVKRSRRLRQKARGAGGA